MMKKLTFLLLFVLLISFSACAKKEVLNKDPLCGVWAVETTVKDSINMADFQNAEAKKILFRYNDGGYQHDDLTESFKDIEIGAYINNKDQWFNITLSFLPDVKATYVKFIPIFQKKDGTYYVDESQSSFYMRTSENITTTLTSNCKDDMRIGSIKVKLVHEGDEPDNTQTETKE